MESITNINLNMQAPNHAVVYATQGDVLTRKVCAALSDGATPWAIPAGAQALIRYMKPDGTWGAYDSLEDNSSAWSTSSPYTSVTITFAGQVLTVAGTVFCQIIFYNSSDEQLSTFSFRVEVQAAAVADEEIVSSDYFNVLTSVLAEMISIRDQAAAFVGSPLVAEFVSDMTNENKIYVYTGSETGYTAGHWYYYDNWAVPDPAWVDGGVYNSTALSTDTTLTIAGKAADAKAAGDAIGNLKSDLNEVCNPNLLGSVTTGYVLPADGVPLEGASGAYTDYIAVDVGAKYGVLFDTPARGSSWYIRVHGYDSGKVWSRQVTYYTIGSSESGTISKSFTIPSGIAYLRISFAAWDIMTNVHIMKLDNNLFSTAVDRVTRKLIPAVSGENIIELYGNPPATRSHNGVTYTWSGNTCTVATASPSGASDGSYCNVVDGSSSIPSYFKAGHTYKFYYNATDTDIKLQFLVYKNGSYYSTLTLAKDSPFTIPSDASGIIFRVYVAKNAVANGTITPVVIEWPPYPNINSLKIANFGDSLTWGRDGAGSSSTQTIYTITNALKDLGCVADNFGVGNMGYFSEGSGMTAIEKLQATDLTGYDVITLGFGTNDNSAHLGVITDTDGTTILGAMYQCWQYIRTQNSTCVVIFIAPPNASSFGSKERGYWYRWRRGPVDEYSLTGLVKGMREFCLKYSIPFIDNLDNGIDLESLATLQPDGVHFNDNGYKIYSRYIANKIVSCAYSWQTDDHNLTIPIDVKRSSMTSEWYTCSYNSVGSYDFNTGESNSLKLTDYISVLQNRTVRITNFRLNNKNLFAMFDANKDPIGRIYIDENAHDVDSYEYKLPYGCAYIRFCVTNAQQETFNVVYVDYTTTESANEFYPYIFAKDLFSKINNRAPMCVLIDDDTQGLGYVQAFHERCVANDIPGNYAVVTKNLDNSSALASALLQYEDEGFGMLYHCDEQVEAYRGIGAANRDLAVAEANFCAGLRKMNTYGFLDYRWWVVPYGTIDDDMVAIGQRHGMKACLSAANATYITTAKRNNRWKIPRCALNVSDASSSTGYTMASLKADLAACYAENGLFFITTHMNDGWTIVDGELDETGKARFDEAVQYAKNLGYKFVTLSEAMVYWMPVYQLNEMM